MGWIDGMDKWMQSQALQFADQTVQLQCHEREFADFVDAPN